MSPRHRPTELREVTALLEKDHDDVEALALAVLDLLHDIKWSRAPWIAIQRFRKDGPDFVAFGPYPTRGEAERDIGRRIIGTNKENVAYFARVYNKDTLDGPDPEIWEPQI